MSLKFTKFACQTYIPNYTSFVLLEFTLSGIFFSFGICFCRKGLGFMSPRHLPFSSTNAANHGLMRYAALLLTFLCLVVSGTSLQAQQGRWTLTGQVALTATASTLTGTLGGIELTLTDETGSTVSVATSNSAGSYLFANVTTGVFTVTPRRPGTIFFPSSTTLTVTTETVRVPTFTMLPELPVITGRIVMQNNLAVSFPFANITLTNAAAPNVTLRPHVQNDGTFSIAVSTAGTYIVAPQASSLREGYVIAPLDVVSTTNASTTVFVDVAANVNNNRFTLVARIPAYRLSGSVRFDYEPGAAIIDIVQLSATGTALAGTAITTLATVTGEPYSVYVTNASYRITSRLTIGQANFYVSMPTLHTINVRSRDIDTLNFFYDPRYITISGKIVRAIGTARIPVQKLPIRLAQFNTNIIFDSTATDNDGAYSLRVRVLDNTLPLTIILPPPTDYTFTYQNTPLQLRENVVRGTTVALLDIGALRQNTILDDIIATPVPPRQYTITGRVLYRSSAPVREVLTAIVTNATNSMFTITDRRRIVLDADGSYSISVTAGSYQLSFVAERHIFSPSLRTLDVPRETEGFRQNFQAVLETMTVTGVVQTILGTPITGATIRLGGGGVDGITVQTDAVGRYRVAVPEQFPENRFFLVPSAQETAFYPPSRLVVVNFATPNLVNMDFRATSTTSTLPLATISGRITVRESAQERGLADVIISDGTRSIKTDANGDYVLSNVPNGNYTLTASLENYSFTPPSLTISVIGGSRPRNQNFVANLRPFTANRAPVLQAQPNDIPVIAASTTRVPIAALFSDPNGDALTFSGYVEDPTILRTRISDGVLFIDALTEGNTMVNVVANDNRGGTVTASFRVTVNRPVIAPRLFTRPKGNINTNFNAALIVRAETLITMLAQTSGGGGGKDNTTVNATSGELGAFNSNCECVGSIVWTGTDAVLPVWAEDKENNIPGMKENEPIDIRFIDEINRKSRRGRLLYILDRQQPTPGIWPIDQGIINIAEINDDPCVATITSVFSSSNAATNSLKASIQPNPSVSHAQLRYTLPAAGKVSIELWNTLGQLVSKVHEGYQDGGEQVFDVDVDKLPTGTYLCRIRRDGMAIGDVSTVRISVIR